MEQLNLASLPKYLSNEASAWELLERLRWSEGQIVCPHCGVIDPLHYFIASKSGERKTRTGQKTYRRLWRCRDKDCRKQFSVLIGTIFESSKVPVSKWLLAMWLMGAGKNGVSALELQRHLGISYQTAWFMAHRLREAMTREPLSALLSGTIVADETWVGGAPKNRHAHKRVEGKQGLTDKTPVVALVHKETGQVRTRVVANVNGENLRQVLTSYVDPRPLICTPTRPRLIRHSGESSPPTARSTTTPGSTCAMESARTRPSPSLLSSSEASTGLITT